MMRRVSLVVLVLAALACPGSGAGSPIRPKDKEALLAIWKERDESLHRMDNALAEGWPAEYYAAMHGLLFRSSKVKDAVKKIKDRLVKEMAKLQIKNMKMGLGKDPESWPPPDPESFDARQKALERLPDVIKYDVIFDKNVSARIEITFVTCRRDPEAFVPNEVYLKRDLMRLRACLEDFHKAIDAL